MIRIVILALAWFLSGVAITWSLGFSLLNSTQVGLIGLIIALVYLAILILPNDYNRKLFFEGPTVDDEFYLHIGCLWYIPLMALTWVPIILLIRLL